MAPSDADSGQMRAVVRPCQSFDDSLKLSTTPHQPVNSCSAFEAKEPACELTENPSIHLFELSSYNNKPTLCQTATSPAQPLDQRLQSTPQRQPAPQTSGWGWSNLPQPSEPWQNHYIWEVSSGNEGGGARKPNAYGWHWPKERANLFQDYASLHTAQLMLYSWANWATLLPHTPYSPDLCPHMSSLSSISTTFCRKIFLNQKSAENTS